MMNKLAVVLAAVLPLATADAPASLPTISTWGYAGSGCAQSSKVTKTGSGWGDLGFEFPPTFNAVSGTPSGSTKNCLVSLQGVDAEPGWQVAVASVSIAGHATIQPGEKVEYLLSTSWAGRQPTGTDRNGTANVDSTVIDTAVSYEATIPADGLAWSDCISSNGFTGILSVNLRSITPFSKAGSSHSFATDKVNFVWQKC